MRTSELFTSFSDRQRDAGCRTRGWGRKGGGGGGGEKKWACCPRPQPCTHVSSNLYVKLYWCIDLPTLGWDLFLTILNNRWGIMTQVVVDVIAQHPVCHKGRMLLYSNLRTKLMAKWWNSILKRSTLKIWTFSKAPLTLWSHHPYADKTGQKTMHGIYHGTTLSPKQQAKIHFHTQTQRFGNSWLSE